MFTNISMHPTFIHAIILPLAGWWVIRQAFMSIKRSSTHCGLSAGRRGISHEACPELDYGSPDFQTDWRLSWRLEPAPRGPGTVLVGAKWNPGEEVPRWTTHMPLFHTCFLQLLSTSRENTQNTWQLMSSLMLFYSYRAMGQRQRQTSKEAAQNKIHLDWMFLQVSGTVITMHLSRTSSSTFCTKVEIHQEKEWIWQTWESKAIFQ